MPRLALPLLLATASVLQLGMAQTISRIQNRHVDNFNAQVMMPVRTQLDGWRVHLIFDKPVASIEEIGEAGVTKLNDYEFVLTNRSYNARQSQGLMNFNVNGHLTGSDEAPTVICSYLEGVDNDNVCLRHTSTTPSSSGASSVSTDTPAPPTQSVSVTPTGTLGVSTDTSAPPTVAVPVTPTGTPSGTLGVSTDTAAQPTTAVPVTPTGTPSGTLGVSTDTPAPPTVAVPVTPIGTSAGTFSVSTDTPAPPTIAVPVTPTGTSAGTSNVSTDTPAPPTIAVPVTPTGTLGVSTDTPAPPTIAVPVTPTGTLGVSTDTPALPTIAVPVTPSGTLGVSTDTPAPLTIAVPVTPSGTLGVSTDTPAPPTIAVPVTPPGTLGVSTDTPAPPTIAVPVTPSGTLGVSTDTPAPPTIAVPVTPSGTLGVSTDTPAPPTVTVPVTPSGTPAVTLGVSTDTPAPPTVPLPVTPSGTPTGTSSVSTDTPVPPTVFSPTTSSVKGVKNYAEAIRLSQMFYDAQRSGELPENNPIPWRDDSALNDCVVGGWYDAGDHVKFGFPMAGALTMLLWGVDRFKDGYQAAGQLDKMYDTVKWGLDYLVHAWDPFKQELVIQIGEGNLDHAYWGRPEDMTMPRPCIKIGFERPGSDVAGETAAALAAGALVFKDKGDIQYAAKLLETAQSIYRFATENRGRFSDFPDERLGYSSSSDKDEMCEAGVWLYRATGDETYLVNAKREHEGIIPTELSWDDKMASCDLLLYEVTHSGNYRHDVENFLSSWQPGGDKLYTPCGFVWGNSTYWGSARHAANVAFAALLAAEDGIDPEVNRKWAAEQINYLLGDNPHDGGCFSYEIGYGDKYPLQPHHRAASCPDMPAPCTEDNLHVDVPSPHILYGGLVGGPIYNDGYNDTREDYVHNEVALDYNAGFQSALAGLMHLVATAQFPDTENKCPCTE
ncbi:hypothetical protein BaRGS_00027355 [Batillaria attramentaria]|uniref:Endoglucanase n=1 Tax=Batillaria attramentaria TaxID=370345 RepID=A0ABD0K2F1_9CAEN